MKDVYVSPCPVKKQYCLTKLTGWFIEEKLCGECHAKHVIMKIYDEVQKAIESGVPYRTRLDPPPADATVAHAGWDGVEVQCQNMPRLISPLYVCRFVEKSAQAIREAKRSSVEGSEGDLY